jgi:hypothetical protein
MCVEKLLCGWQLAPAVLCLWHEVCSRPFQSLLLFVLNFIGPRDECFRILFMDYIHLKYYSDLLYYWLIFFSVIPHWMQEKFAKMYIRHWLIRGDFRVIYCRRLTVRFGEKKYQKQCISKFLQKIIPFFTISSYVRKDHSQLQRAPKNFHYLKQMHLNLYMSALFVCKGAIFQECVL